MTRYECPACDGDEIEVTERLIQELDPVSKTVLHSELRKKLVCRHCGWSGRATEAMQQEDEPEKVTQSRKLTGVSHQPL